MAAQTLGPSLETLEDIREFIAENGYPPSLRELMVLAGVQMQAVHDRLRTLERHGLIQRDRGIARGIRVLRAA